MTRFNRTLFILILILLAVPACFAKGQFTFGTGAGFQNISYSVELESDLDKFADRNAWGALARAAYSYQFNDMLAAGPSLTWEIYSFKDFRSYNHLKLSADVRFTFLRLMDNKLELTAIAGPGIDFGMSEDGLKAFYFMARAGLGTSYMLNEKLGFTLDLMADMTFQDGSRAFNATASIGVVLRYGTGQEKVPGPAYMPVSIAEPEPVSEPEPVAESVAEPVTEPEPAVEPEPVMEPEPVAEPAAEPEKPAKIQEEPVYIKADTEHNYGSWEIIVTRSCTKEGVAIRTCLDCGHIEPVKLPRLPHTPGVMRYNERLHWQFCEECGKLLLIEYHDFRNGTCVVCGYAGGAK